MSSSLSESSSMPEDRPAAALARQVSGRDENDRFILSVIVKRTYALSATGEPVLADEQVPLVDDAAFDGPHGALLDDTDLYPFKPATDVILKGHAHLTMLSGSAKPSGLVALRVGSRERRIAVFGDRRCRLSSGRIVFGKQSPVERVPLTFAFAYGGRDRVAERTHGNPALKWAGPFGVSAEDVENASPYLYPRNHVGRGYLIDATPEAVEAVQLPNLEDPDNLLTQDRLAVGSVDNWPAMPLPAVFGWVHPAWFPRLVLAGIPYGAPGFAGEAEETRRGWAPGGLLGEEAPGPGTLRFANGASFGMQLPYLKGGEPVLLEGVRPNDERLTFTLPRERPELHTDGRKGTFKPTAPVIHTLILEPDRMRMSIVWRGSAEALRTYLPQELDRMPFRVAWTSY
jgi:hypothetical protein